MAKVVELEIPAHPEFVALARTVVGSVAGDRRDLGDERLADLKLAVSEACTNAIEAHASAVTDERVVVRCFEDESRFCVWIDDRGPGFDPASAKAPLPIGDIARFESEGGLGIPLIRALVDAVDFESSGTGTSVRLTVRCRPVKAQKQKA